MVARASRRCGGVRSKVTMIWRWRADRSWLSCREGRSGGGSVRRGGGRSGSQSVSGGRQGVAVYRRDWEALTAPTDTLTARRHRVTGRRRTSRQPRQPISGRLAGRPGQHEPPGRPENLPGPPREPPGPPREPPRAAQRTSQDRPENLPGPPREPPRASLRTSQT